MVGGVPSEREMRMLLYRLPIFKAGPLCQCRDATNKLSSRPRLETPGKKYTRMKRET